jgi:DNA-binding NarL/FixJ family response regulator
MLRECIKGLLSEVVDLEVVGEAGDGLEIFSLLGRVKPDLVILDIGMPNLGGIEATQKIRIDFPHVRILILTMEKNIDYVCQAASLGVAGYLLEEESIIELFSAIRLIREGGTYVSPRLFPLVPDNLAKTCYQDLRQVFDVTPREKEILRLIAEGKSNSEIASLLFISIRTVEHHRANIMNKLSLRRITDLIKYAIRNGFVTP